MSPPGPGWIDTVRLLLATARMRRAGRLRGIQARKASKTVNVGYGMAVLGNVMMQAFLAGMYLWMASLVAAASADRQGTMVVSESFYTALQQVDSRDGLTRRDVPDRDPDVARAFDEEAKSLRADRGGDRDDWRNALAARYRERGIAAFAPDSVKSAASLASEQRALALFLVVWWLALVLQGEGPNLDSMRRRHPMWEWYLGFPVPQSAVFVAEALEPAASNPFLLASPLVPMVLVGWTHQSVLAGLAALPIGLPLLVAASLWAKALEVLILLRSPIRNRGAWFALLGMAGAPILLAPLVLLNAHGLCWKFAGWVARLPDAVPSAHALLGAGDPAGWVVAMATSLGIGLLLAVPAVALMHYASLRGLEAGFGSAAIRAKEGAFGLRRRGPLGFLDDPLLRKERLWLKRDRGALLQLVGVPMVLMFTQSLNFQNILRDMTMSWNRLAGAIFVAAAMLLAAAGPRTLIGEGPALMLTLSWPRSLEDTLRMKVRVLCAIVTAMVWIALGVAIWVYPHDAPGLVGTGLLWPLFALCIAEKSVTLIQSPRASGESEPVPMGQRYMATLGNSTFGVAVFMGLWPLAFASIATNWVFAGALWQRFRVRIAYLFDPVSEPEVRPPTILSSVLALVGMQELGAILAIPFLVVLGREAMPFAFAICYGVAAVIVCGLVVSWQKRRGVELREVLTLEGTAALWPAGACAGALCAGALLGCVGFAYQLVLPHLPWPQLHQVVSDGARYLSQSPNARGAYAIMAIGVAPWAEEFLFRGLMFRAMREQWGVRRAAFASAAFFAVLHPWPAWPMVFLLGAGSAFLYERGRSLVPCMLLHAAYNGVLLALTFRT